MSTRRQQVRRRSGIALMAMSLGIAGSVLSLAPAGAQAEPQPLEVEATAYFVRSATKAAPDTVTSEFPPGVVCVVQPALCPEEIAPVTGPLGEGLGQAEEAPAEEPAGAVAPGTLPVLVEAGEERYSAALKFVLPEVPAGQEVGQFVLQLEMINPSYHSSSPAFRQAVLAAVASAGCKCFSQEEWEKVQETDPAEEGQFLGVEACPVLAPFEDSDAGQKAELQPKLDCLFGANGVQDEDGLWSFDLGFAADAWYSGAMENHGIVLRTTGAPNLAFGDPDTSTYSRVTYASSSAQVLVEQRPASEPPAPFTPPADNTTNSSPGFSTPSSSGNIFAAPQNFTPEAAQVADAAPEVAGEAPAQQPVAAVPFLTDGEPLTPWWIWLLVPIFLAGMYLTAQSLTTEVVLASERDGAMMRLIEQRRGGMASRGPSGPREGALSRLTGQK